MLTSIELMIKGQIPGLGSVIRAQKTVREHKHLILALTVVALGVFASKHSSFVGKRVVFTVLSPCELC